MLEVSDIKKSYRRKNVLEHISFRADCGECVAIVGRNGCGKTTLMQILSGVIRPDEGGLRYFGKDPLSKMKYFQKFCGYVPQELPLMEELSVKDNLRLWGVGTRKEDQELIREITSIDGVTSVKEVNGFGIKFDYPAQDEYDKNDIIYPLHTEELPAISSYLEEGSADAQKLLSGEYILMADNDLAEEIYGWRFAAGDTVVMHYYDGSQLAEKEVTVLGILNRQFLLDHSSFEGWFLMPEQTIRSLVSYNSFCTHLLVATETEKEAAIGEQLEQIIAKKPALTMDTLAENRILHAQSCEQMFGAISGLSIFIMMFSILSMMNTLITNIVTRKQELAMLESIGMSKGQIRKMLLGESLILVLFTVGVTMTAGTACGYVLCGILYKNGAFYMAFRFPWMFALAYTGILVIVPLAITFLSMKSFSKEALVQRLRGVEGA